jgi:serine/threonine-protein kinase
MSEMIERLNAALQGRYRIERQLGEGGMATVFLAEDVKHRRSVALKVLKPELAAVVGADRFLAEIETTANLQHPHILPLYDSGEADSFLFYVMPYVEGESLREKLDREKQLPVDDAVRIAKAVAGGLDYAHRQGVVHRDIKPANILLQDGEPVIADFGIALAIQEAGGGRLTETGLSLGTPYYMSPEQATADRDPDARSDVYSLGCVLYEMLTGEPPFTGNSAQSVLGKILTADAVAPTQLRSTVPAQVEAAVLRSLAKVPADRFGNAAELARALDDQGPLRASAGARTEGGVPDTVGASLLPRWAIRAVAGLAVAIVAFLFGIILGGPRGAGTAPAPHVRAVLELPGDAVLIGPRVAISRDGSTVAVTGLSGGTPMILARKLDRLDFFPVPGTDAGEQQFLSPDGRTVAFRAGGEMRRVPLAGGTPVAMDADANWAGGDWTEDGTVVYTRSYRSGLWRLGADGRPEQVTEPRDDELGHWWPQVLPDGEHVLFTAFRTPLEDSRIGILSLETGERMDVFQGGVHARYLPTGHLLYARGDALYAVPFDLESGQAMGESTVVVDDVAMDHSSGLAAYDISTDGTLVYIRASELNAPSRLVWVDRDGGEEPVVPDPEVYSQVDISPDGKTVAVVINQPGQAEDLWTIDLARGTRTRIAAGAGADFAPLWTPDGGRLIYTSEQPVFDLYVRTSDASAPASPLVSSDFDKYAGSVTADGRSLLFHRTTEDGSELWKVALDGQSEPEPVLAPGYNVSEPAASPDGSWIAYVSDESGRDQVYLSSYPDPGRLRRQVSVNGGVSPRWTRAGREIVYQHGDRMWAVAVDPETGELGRPELLFEGPYRMAPIGSTRGYDVTPDGRRFLMVKRAEGREPRRVIVVTDFYAELRALNDGDTP